MVFGEINSALTLWERFSKWRRSRKTPSAPAIESVATRFVRLLESHGVHRNQIPRFIGHGLMPKDVVDDATLLINLSEEILHAVCTRFAVRREWLDGADTQIHPCHDFYKHPEEFLIFIKDLLKCNPGGDIEGVLITPQERVWKADALLVLQETVGYVGEKPIRRFHLCNNWGFSYWKARAYLTACIAIAWNRDVYVHGIIKPMIEIEQLAHGETLLGWQGEGIWALGHKTWNPEDMALRPEAFLEGIDPEQNDFGIKSGLKLWLDLEAQGLMVPDITADARPAFERELSKYSPS